MPQPTIEPGPSWVQAACELEPDHRVHLNHVGIAQYRVGLCADALETLTRSDKLNGGHPHDAAFLAMTLHELGRTEEARAALRRLRRLMEDPRFKGHGHMQRFVAEAEGLIHPGHPE